MGVVNEENHFVLCTHFTELGRMDKFADFWEACFNRISLGRAMYLCNVAGVNIP